MSIAKNIATRLQAHTALTAASAVQKLSKALAIKLGLGETRFSKDELNTGILKFVKPVKPEVVVKKLTAIGAKKKGKKFVVTFPEHDSYTLVVGVFPSGNLSVDAN